VNIPKDEKGYFFNNTYLQQQQEMRKQNANKQWTALEKEMAGSSSYSTSSTVVKSISGVPNYIWRNGCAPIAAGMVLGYWDSHGYPNFPGKTTLIDELADSMGTSDWPRGYGATWPWDIDTGIQAVCVMHSYIDFDVSNIFNSSVTWDAVKNEVNVNRPFVLSMLHGGTAVGNSQAYNEHSVTCMGYSDGDGNNDYLLLHDTWDNTTTRYLAYGSWWGAMATWVRPNQ